MKKRKPSRRKSSKKTRSPNRKHSSPRRKVGAHPGRDWVGGRVLAPLFVGEDAPYRPVLELWVANGYIVHFELHDPNEPIAPVSKELREKLLYPPIGGKPRRLRLSDEGWAAQVRRELPGLDVVSGPTPELEGPLDELTSRMQDESPASYLEDRLSAEDMAALFTAADALYRLEPWKILDDDQLIEVNIPELDVQGACLSIIGALGESYGMILFASLTDYERMLEIAEELETTGDVRETDLVMTSLNYERGADLPASLRREVEKYGWPVAAATAYPIVEHRGLDGSARAVTPRELHVITACIESLVSTLEQHPDAFAADGLPHFSLSQVDRRGVEVHLKSPPTGWKAGGVGDQPSDLEMLDDTLLVRLFDYAHARWGRRFSDRVIRLIRDQAEAQLLFRVGAYHLAVEGEKTVAQCFSEEHASTLDDTQRRWLAAQQTAWLSLWELKRIVPGEGLELRDLLTGESLWVANEAASGRLPEHGVLLARVVRCDEEYELKAHPVALSLSAAADVAERMRKYLRTRSAVAPERLRHPNSVRYLLRRWQDVIEEIHEALAHSGSRSRRSGGR